MKTYHVQTWNKDGGLGNSYEVQLENDRALAELKRFLKGKQGHFLVTRVADKKPLKAPTPAPFRKRR